MKIKEKNAPLYYRMSKYLDDLKKLSTETNPEVSEEINRVSSALNKVIKEIKSKYVGKRASYHSFITEKTRIGTIERFSHFGPYDFNFILRYEDPNLGFDYVSLSEVDFSCE